jgi:hypothetical protein
MTSNDTPKKFTAKLVSRHKGKPSKLSRKNTTTERTINGMKRRQSNTTTKSPHIKLKKKPEKSNLLKKKKEKQKLPKKKTEKENLPKMAAERELFRPKNEPVFWHRSAQPL